MKYIKTYLPYVAVFLVGAAAEKKVGIIARIPGLNQLL